MIDFRIDSGTSIQDAIAAIGGTPKQIARAQARTYSLMATWMQRRILQEISRATGIPQSRFKKMARLFWSKIGQNGLDGVKFWIGTKPVKVHRLGTVRWTPYLGSPSRPKSKPKSPSRSIGAKVGRKSYPGTWSWPAPAKTAPAVMQRTGTFGRRGNPKLERIETVSEPIHASARAALTALMPEIEARFANTLRQQLNYYVNVRGKAA